MRPLVPVLLAALTASCGGSSPSPSRPVPTPAPAPVPASSAAPADALGPRPTPASPPPFVPPVPVTYTRKDGLTVWLLERHALPIVSLSVVLPVGSARDPSHLPGLAHVTADMLDEGAGTRGALELARDADALGASLSTGASTDYAFVQLTVLTKNLAPALSLWGDVVARPRFADKEWARVSDLWQNALAARTSEPGEVASVVVQRVGFPPGHPYAHPSEGTMRAAKTVRLADAKRFYETYWHPEGAVVVAVGDVTRATLDPLLDKALAGWKPSDCGKKPEPTPACAAPPTFLAPKDAPSPPRVVVVDRPEAPQSVIAFVGPGVAAADEASAPLVRVNAALGGSFTSRLNMELREKRGFSYGASSRFSFSRLPGLFSAQASVQTEHTGEALRALLGEIDALAKQGLTEEEVDRSRKLSRGALVDTYEGVSGAARRLARNAGAGLPPDHDAKNAVRIDQATAPELVALAKKHLDTTHGSIVIVGPRARIEPQLKALADIGLATFVVRGPEGE